MNYALLSKIRTSPENRDRLIEKKKYHLGFNRHNNQGETLFYLSSSKPDEFYMLGFWYTLMSLNEALLEMQQVKHQITLDEFEDTRLINRTIFKMVFETRNVHFNTGASNLRLTRYPEHFSTEHIQKIRQSPKFVQLEESAVLTTAL
jgi:hypothetical protein